MIVFQESMKNSGLNNIPDLKLKNIVIGLLIMGGVITTLYILKKRRNDNK